MKVGPVDTLVALKAINLTPALSGTEKRVAATILDHFNRKTGRCDPSLGRIASLLGISRRTVIRAISRLEAARLFRRERHGGLSHRNRYEPLWPRFYELEEQWKARLYAKRAGASRQDMAPLLRQSCQIAGGGAGTQTCLNNQCIETFLNQRKRGNLSTPNEPMICKRLGKIVNDHTVENSVSQIASSKRHIEIARSAAERRLNSALQNAYGATPKSYAEVLDAIDPTMWSAAAEAELHKHGAGLAFILERLKVGSAANKSREPGEAE